MHVCGSVVLTRLFAVPLIWVNLVLILVELILG